MIWFLLILFFLSVYRVTRLVIADRFPPIAWLRAKATAGRPDTHWLVYMLGNDRRYGCPWCVSVWVGGIGVLILSQLQHGWPWFTWVMVWLASSVFTGVLWKTEGE